MRLDVGNIVTLSDPQTLEMMVEEDAPLGEGLNLTISEKQTFESGGVFWTVYEFEQDEICLLTKECGGHCDIRVMFTPPGHVDGDRLDVVESGNGWLFEAPRDEEDFAYDELKLADGIESPDGVFNQKNGTLYGTTDRGDTFVGVTEWNSNAKENGELILFEIGGEDDERGGYLRLLQGTNIAESDIEVLVLQD